MRYLSTRGDRTPRRFCEILLEGLAPDGGLYMPETYPILSRNDLERLRRVFERLAKDGEVIMPLEPAFFSPLFGQVRDKFGFYWMIMSSEEVEF